MTTAISAAGSLLKKAGTTIAEVKTAAHSGMKLDMLDVTSHDSTGKWKEFIVGLKEGGELTAEGNFTNAASQAAFITDLQAGTSASYTLAFGATPVATVTVTAFPMSIDISAPVEGDLGFSLTLKITGQPAYS